MVQVLVDGGEAIETLGQDATVAEQNAAVRQLSQGFREQLQTLQQGVATPQQQLTTLLSSTQTRLEALLMNEDYNAADALLTTLEVLSEQEIKVGPNNSINFWDIRVKNGNKGTLSVQKFIRTNREQLTKSVTGAMHARGRWRCWAWLSVPRKVTQTHEQSFQQLSLICRQLVLSRQ